MKNRVQNMWLRVSSLFLIFLTAATISNACNLGSLTINSGVDNGDGTFSYTISVCLAVDVSWGTVTSFDLTSAGATIIGVSGTWTSSYQYCDATCPFMGGCPGSIFSGGGSATGSVMNGTVTFSGGGGTGNWLSPDDLNATCITQPAQVCDQVTITTNGPITSVTGTWDEGTTECTHTDATIPPITSACIPPLAGFTDDGPHCQGVAFTFTNTGDPAGGMGQPSIDWDFGDGVGTATVENPSYTYATAGTYTVTQTICDAADPTCCATATGAVTVTAPPTVTVSGVDESCPGACDGTASSTVTGGTSPFVYAWSPSGGTGASAAGLCAGSYTLSVTDAGGCAAVTASVAIGTGPAPLGGFNFSGVTCLTSNSFSFSNTGAAVGSCGMNCPTFTYDFGDGSPPVSGTNTAAASPTYSYGACGTFTVTQTINDGTCSVITTQTVTVTCPPTLAITPTDESCAGACDGALNLTPSGGVTPYTYAWSNGPNTQDQTSLCAGTYTVTVTDASGCVTTINGTVGTLGTPPLAGFTYNGNQCLTGNSFVFTNTGTPDNMGNPTFSWDFGDGSGTSTLENPTYTYGTTGTFTVTQTVTDISGCFATATLTVIVYPEPTATLTGIDETCPGSCDGSANLTPSGGTAPYTYSWGGGQTTQDLTGLCAGTYNVTVNDINGCLTTATVVIASGVAPLAGFNASPTSACLTGNSFSFNNTGAAVSSCGMGCPTFTYDYGDGSPPASGTNSSAANPSHTYASPGTYTVTQTIDDGSCPVTATQTITVFAEPTGVIVGGNLLCTGVCIGTADLAPSGGLAPYAYAWSNLATTQDLAGLCAGTYSVTITDANGCTGTASVVITEPPLLTLGTAGTNILCAGACTGSATSVAGGGTAPYTYSWNTTPVQVTSGATGLCAGTYTLTLTDANGCVLTDNVIITEPPVLTNTIAGTNLDCFGVCNGDATVTPAGGTSPYTYAWDDPLFQATATAGGLCAGTFNVTVTDA
ncbi:MAG: PKD domain-containing protein, partial [Flavobacteriales bacterium]|nr:PKD domain-containing protein [Flavobacteriales bacterium]